MQNIYGDGLMNPRKFTHEKRHPVEKNVKDLTYKDLAKMARNEAEAFATNIIGEAPCYRTGSEVRYYKNQSLRVFISGPKQGRYSSFADDSARGDLFDLWRYVRGGNPHDAVMGYKNFAGLIDNKSQKTVKIDRGPSQEEIKLQEQKDIAKRMRTAQWIWKNASPKNGRDEGLAYLRGRGITIEPSSDAVRFRKISTQDLEKMGVKSDEIPKTPVTSIIFKATNGKGEISAVQQILITEGKKVAFDNPKRTNGYLVGASVLLGEVKEGKLAIAEGPETALSIHQATGIATMITLGTSNFTNISVPGNVDTMIIASDMDKSGVGLGSSLKAAQYWSRNGVNKAGIALPRLEEGDCNDVLQNEGNEAVAQVIETAFFPVKTRHDEVVLVTPDSRVAFHAWMKTGVSTSVRIPPVNKNTGKRIVNLDSAIEEHQKIAFLIGRKGFEFDTEYTEKHREDVKLIHVTDDSEEFLSSAKTAGYVESVIQQADIYAPQGIGQDDPVAITLRRKDADVLCAAGHMAIAVRATEVDSVDLSFMKGRNAIITPVGKGSSIDGTLEDRLNETGAETTRFTWQIFRPSKTGLEIVRNDIPKNYGAAEAVSEGWKGVAMGHLLLISELNRAQLERSSVQENSKPRDQVEL
jgi:phage/plasmid primase-like uncharacterized protein